MTTPTTPENQGDWYQPMFGEPVGPWFRWFAWRPTLTVDRGWRWLRPVWKRRIGKHDYLPGGSDFWFQTAIQIEPNGDDQ